MHKIKKGDEIIVITGKDKGKKGTVSEVLLKGQKLMVDAFYKYFCWLLEAMVLVEACNTYSLADNIIQ